VPITIGAPYMAVTFDTLKFVQTLENAGVAREQATAIASAVRDSHNAADVATKGDLRELELRMLAAVSAAENKLTGRVGAMLAVAIGVLLAVLPMVLGRYLPKLPV